MHQADLGCLHVLLFVKDLERDIRLGQFTTCLITFSVSLPLPTVPVVGGESWNN